ncbi:hypothetical protein PAA8504_02105 [Palleronia abyssalis]|uniref:Exopolysaccharide synthesis, ExoD n=1 Tax=Palleronia abyssalis TaxID=1501240 RepID=A0A2R8BVT1_9RHOB|nr:hypothetical protein PAA8504_02105 [Palleronia abyssalis]
MSDGLNDILDDLNDLAGAEETVSLNDVIGKLGSRGQGVVLLLPGLMGITPIGGIPGVPTISSVLITILAVQIILGQRQLWVPDMIGRRSVEDDRIRNATERLRGLADWIDRHFGNRLEALTGSIANRIAAGFCLLLAFTMPPLELVPFAGIIPFAGIAMLGLGLTLRDGVLMALAFASSVLAFYGVWRFWPF